jgi:hypothetical protein
LARRVHPDIRVGIAIQLRPSIVIILTALGGNRVKVSVCMVTGIVLWSVILTLAALLGAAALGV